ncbi:hypothetical protein [Cerasicoccus frondis]|uniref:hypothetical protein n=1 Tax=Cerasicoccus frondis TaxID=490090 RepID=UPI002852AEBE|nr:hypothetical protein [Cerasicoccus frondis]
MSKRVCRECENPLPKDADYCGRCGEGVRQIPIGCAVIGLLAAAGAVVGFLLYLKSAL